MEPSGRSIRKLSIQDAVALGYTAYMFLRVCLAADSPQATVGRLVFGTALAVLAVLITLVRGGLWPAGRARAIAYRVGLIATIAVPYLGMRATLAALTPTHLYDGELAALDRLLFGVEPSRWLERFATPITTEWFAFFYYGYYFLLAANVLPALILGRGRASRDLLFGALLILSLGHIGYTLVPGLGPYASLTFDGALTGGLFLKLVQTAVREAGALLDIFPSLHTALPVFMTLHAYRNRETPTFRVAWPALAFCAANIVVATLFLRWHHGVDVLVGLLLAAFTAWLAPKVGRLEERRLSEPVWEPLFGPGEPAWLDRLTRPKGADRCASSSSR